jgi:hypothetical protein
VFSHEVAVASLLSPSYTKLPQRVPQKRGKVIRCMSEGLLPLAQFLLFRTWVKKEQGAETHDLTPSPGIQE